MSKCILKIGCEHILLPNMDGVQTIMKALGRGALVRDRMFKGEIEFIHDREMNLELVMVPDSYRIVQKPRRADVHSKQIKELPPGKVVQLGSNTQLLLGEGGR